MFSLKSVRKSKGMSQKELAEMCGKSRSTVCEIERGYIKPSVPFAKRMAAILGIDWTLFYPDDDEEGDK